MIFVGIFDSRLVTTVFSVMFCALFALGCGTTKWSDTSRTGTEQLLISNAIDNAVGKIDFSPVRGRRVFLKTEAITEATDNKYLAMALRQQLATFGGILCDVIDDADYVVEARVGAIGTDRDEQLLVGVPAMTLPTLPGANYSGNIPEIPIIKRTKQRGVAKLAVFAYNKQTGNPLWASGNNQYESSARNLWFAGSGPLTRGTIYDRATFAGHPMPDFMQNEKDRRISSFADHVAHFSEPPNAPRLKFPIEKRNPEQIVPMEVAADKPTSGVLPNTPDTSASSFSRPLPIPVPPSGPYAAPYRVPQSVFDEIQ